MTTGSIIVLAAMIAIISLSVFALIHGMRKGKGCCGCSGGTCSCCKSAPQIPSDEKH